MTSGVIADSIVNLCGAIGVAVAMMTFYRRDPRSPLTRRLLLTVSTDQGAPLPAGASVSSANGEFITLVQDGSQVFLPNVLDQTTLWITTPQGGRCQLHYQLAAKADPSVYFESAPARCRVP